jgi:hypothetical protein
MYKCSRLQIAKPWVDATAVIARHICSSAESQGATMVLTLHSYLPLKMMQDDAFFFRPICHLEIMWHKITNRTAHNIPEIECISSALTIDHKWISEFQALPTAKTHLRL